MSRGHESVEPREGGQEFETTITLTHSQYLDWLNRRIQGEKIDTIFQTKIKELYGDHVKVTQVFNPEDVDSGVVRFTVKYKK